MITVFTATYNRANYLNTLYKSLLNQKYKNFEWLIVDDGSTDGTDELIKKHITEEKINIRYYSQENRGKYKCINKGIDLAKGDLFFIVDSDDFISNDALEKIMLWVQQLKKEDNFKDFIGVAGLKVNYNNNNMIVGTTHKFNYLDATTLEYRYKYKIKGDKAEVFFLSELKKYKFPIIDESEKFQTEAIIFNKMAQDGKKIRWYNDEIYYCEYLEDGLTMNSYKRRIENWNGYVYYYNQIINCEIPYIEKIRELSNYYRFGLNKYSLSKLNKSIKSNILPIICIPLGLIYFNIDKYKKLKRGEKSWDIVH